MLIEKFTVLLVLLFCVYSTAAQNKIKFENIGKHIFETLIDTNRSFAPEYIRIKEYEYLIDQQKTIKSKKELMKYSMNQNYNHEYKRFQKSVDYLAEEYKNEVITGTQMEYLNTYWEPLAESELSYTVVTSFLYKAENVQTEVSLIYNVAWIKDHFALISPIEENF